MPVWLIWGIVVSGLAAAVSYRKTKDLGVDPLTGKPVRSSAKP